MIQEHKPKTLKEFLLEGGIKGKIFIHEQEITQRKIYYQVLDIGAIGRDYNAQAFLFIQYLNSRLKPSGPKKRIFLTKHLEDKLYEQT